MSSCTPEYTKLHHFLQYVAMRDIPLARHPSSATSLKQYISPKLYIPCLNIDLRPSISNVKLANYSWHDVIN